MERCQVLSSNVDSFKSTLTHVLDQFKLRFQDLNHIQNDLNLFNNPMQCEIAEQKPEIRLELCDLQTDNIVFLFQDKRRDYVFSEYFLMKNIRNCSDFGLKIGSMIGSTYNCESSFPIMKCIKNSHRTALTDSSLSKLMHIAITKNEVDIRDLVNNVPKPQCSH